MAEIERSSVGRERIIAFDTNIKEYLKEIDEASLLTMEQEHMLGKRIVEENDPEARELLVRSNLRLVVNIAKKYANRGMGLGDLIEEGNLGLLKAVDYFDPDRGTRFSTYAAWWIKQCIKRALLMNIQPVHVPTYMVTLINQWRHTSIELSNKFGRAPSLEEVAEIMQLPLRKAKIIKEVVKILSSTREISVTDDDDDDGHQMTDGALENLGAENPEDDMAASEEQAKVLSLLDKIDSREANVLRLHYGLNGTEPLTLRQIGAKLGLTRERIRQIQRHALTKLYEYMHEE